jgi:molybdenum cofactor sulfurtransferase
VLDSDGREAQAHDAAGLPCALAAFLAAHPAYAAGAPALDALRAGDYSRLDRLGHVYLDYTGGGLYAESQLRAHHELMTGQVFGNPHSHNPTSTAATGLVEEARDAVRRFFNASEDEYEVVFTANASGALKLVGESYPFEDGSCYLVAYDNHNSVNGIREFARRGGAEVVYVPVRRPDLRLDEALIRRGLAEHASCPNRLFAYPAQSNFSGVQHPLEWIAEAQGLGWDVLLDCAAFAPTNRLDLGEIKPDFVPLSFYKMFGYPTGLGALIARRDKLAKLRRPWFAGGTITLASVQGEGWYHLAPGSTGFEDGTVDYLGLPAVTIGLRHLESIGIDTVHERVTDLSDWLLDRMRDATHTNGSPMFRIFGPDTMDRRGSTIAFYLLDPEGGVYDVYAVEKLAGDRLISVRTGCFCNPGDGEVAHRITREEMAECFVEPAVPVTLTDCQRIIQDATGKLPNTIRVSLGIASDFADVHRFREFAEGFRDVPASALGR